MFKAVENTVAVLLVTLLTAVAVYAGVSLAEEPLSATTTASEAAGDIQTCPRTGCTSYGCHATDGTGVPSQGSGATGGAGGRGYGHGFDSWTAPMQPAIPESDGSSSADLST